MEILSEFLSKLTTLEGVQYLSQKVLLIGMAGLVLFILIGMGIGFFTVFGTKKEQREKENSPNYEKMNEQIQNKLNKNPLIFTLYNIGTSIVAGFLFGGGIVYILSTIILWFLK